MSILKSILQLVILTALVACGRTAETGVDKSGVAQPKKDAASVPVNMKNAERDLRADRESSFIVTLLNNNEILLGKDAKPVAKTDFIARVKEFGSGVPPDRRVVYVKADPAIDYKMVLDILDLTRAADFDRINFVVSRTPEAEADSVLEVKLPAKPNAEAIPRPNPLFLVVFMKKDGTLRLNTDDLPLDGVKNKLTEVFRDREKNGVFREGTNETEKTVFIKAPRSVKYGEVVKIVDALKEVGATPVGLQIDDLED